MTNEELALAIQQGQHELIETLWLQCRGFIRWRAYTWKLKFPPWPWLEIDDLVQSGYFALLAAVRYYRPEKGYPFLAYLKNTLKPEFNKVVGMRTSKRDALLMADSYHKPLFHASHILYGDVLPDPGADRAFEFAEASESLRRARAAIRSAATDLLNPNQRKAIAAYCYKEPAISDTACAKKYGLSRKELYNSFNQAIALLRPDRRILYAYALMRLDTLDKFRAIRNRPSITFRQGQAAS